MVPVSYMTMIFITPAQRNRVSLAFLVQNLGTFSSCWKFCNYSNLRELISNMTILFSTSSPKLPQSGIVSAKFKDFYFCTKLCYKTNPRALTSNMTRVFQNCCPKQPNNESLAPNLRIFTFAQKIEIREI